MRVAEQQLGRAFKHQATVARLNCAAVEAAIDAFDHSSPTEEHFAPESVAMGVASLRLLLIPLSLYAVDLECLNATGKSLAEG